MDLYAVIGNPVRYSLSPKIHQQFAQQTKQTIKYIAIESPVSELKTTLHHFFFVANGMGSNITTPFKQQAFEICDQLTPRAKLAGSVNCIKKIGDKLWGDNTDGIGFIRDLSKKRITLDNKKILIFGAGGAAAGIIPEIQNQNPKEIIICNRTVASAEKLKQRFHNLSICDTLEINHLNNPDFIINATSLHANEFNWPWPNISYHENTVCHDLSYHPATPFQNWAKQQKLQIINGLGMLVEQAAEAFYWWRGIFPDTNVN